MQSRVHALTFRGLIAGSLSLAGKQVARLQRCAAAVHVGVILGGAGSCSCSVGRPTERRYRWCRRHRHHHRRGVAAYQVAVFIDPTACGRPPPDTMHAVGAQAQISSSPVCGGCPSLSWIFFFFTSSIQSDATSSAIVPVG